MAELLFAPQAAHNVPSGNSLHAKISGAGLIQIPHRPAKRQQVWTPPGYSPPHHLPETPRTGEVVGVFAPDVVDRPHI